MVTPSRATTSSAWRRETERVIERELAAGAAPDRELSLDELEVVVQVAQAKAHDARLVDLREYGGV